MARGKFITFEGGEGAGKSTQAKRLAERLRAAGLTVATTREPGGSPFGEVIRDLLLDPATPPHAPLAEALLFSAARADHLDKLIRPALAAGTWIICDRFADSTRVYQGAGGGVPMADLVALERVTVGAHTPDLTIILDLPAEVGLARAAARIAPGSARDAYEVRDRAFHERLRGGFLEIARTQPSRCTIVDATQEVDAIAQEIWSHVVARWLQGR